MYYRVNIKCTGEFLQRGHQNCQIITDDSRYLYASYVLSDSRRNIGMLGFKVVCGKLRYYNFTNCPGHVFQWRINLL